MIFHRGIWSCHREKGEISFESGYSYDYNMNSYKCIIKVQPYQRAKHSFIEIGLTTLKRIVELTSIHERSKLLTRTMMIFVINIYKSSSLTYSLSIIESSSKKFFQEIHPIMDMISMIIKRLKNNKLRVNKENFIT